MQACLCRRRPFGEQESLCLCLHLYFSRRSSPNHFAKTSAKQNSQTAVAAVYQPFKTNGVPLQQTKQIGCHCSRRSGCSKTKTERYCSVYETNGVSLQQTKQTLKNTNGASSQQTKQMECHCSRRNGSLKQQHAINFPSFVFASLVR